MLLALAVLVPGCTNKTLAGTGDGEDALADPEITTVKDASGDVCRLISAQEVLAALGRQQAQIGPVRSVAGLCEWRVTTRSPAYDLVLLGRTVPIDGDEVDIRGNSGLISSMELGGCQVSVALSQRREQDLHAPALSVSVSTGSVHDGSTGAECAAARVLLTRAFDRLPARSPAPG